MANDGQIVFEVTADGKHAIADIKEITRAIQNESKKWDDAAKESTDNIDKSFSSMLKKIAAGFSAAKIGKALLDISKEAISAASDLEEVQNVVDVTFGQDGAKKIESWAKTAGAQFGLTETQAKKFSSTIGAMMKSSGIAGDEIQTMSTDLAGLAADMASFYNLDFEEAFDKIKSGMSGMTMPLKSLGIDMSVASLNAFALEKGLSKSYDKMSQGEQTVLRYQYLMKVTADAQGDFARTSDGYANGVRKLETNITGLKTKLGGLLLDVVNPLLNSMNHLFDEKEERFSILDRVAEIDIQKEEKIAEIKAIADEARSLIKLLHEVGNETTIKTTVEVDEVVNYLAMGSENETAIQNLEELGLATDEINAKQTEWLKTCQELEKTIPGISGLINTNTGEVKGGVPALTDYVDEWERMQKIQAEIDALEKLKGVYTAENNVDEKRADMIIKRAQAATRLQNNASKEVQQLLDYYKVDMEDILRYMELVEKGEASQWQTDVMAQVAAVLELQSMATPSDQQEAMGYTALAEYTKALSIYLVTLKELPEVQAIIKAEQEDLNKQLDDAGKTMDDFNTSTGNTATTATTLSKALNNDADAVTELKTALKNAEDALKAVQEHVKGIRDKVSGTIGNVVKGFEKVSYKIDELQEKSRKLGEEEVNTLGDYDKTLSKWMTGGIVDLERMRENWNSLSEKEKEAYNALVKIKNEQKEVNDELNKYKPTGMKQALTEQLEFMTDYLANLEKARAMGLSSELLASLSDGSLESAEYLKGLVADPQGAKEVDALYQQVSKKKEELTGALTDQQLTVDEVYAALLEAAKKAVAELDLGEEAKENAAATIAGISEGIGEKEPEVKAAVDSIIEQLNRLSAWGINFGIPGVTKSIDIPALKWWKAEGSFASGIDYVPRDMLAYIHEGEAVLTEEENKIRHGYGNQQSFDFDTMGGVMRESVKAGGNVYLDGRIVGSVISDQQGRSYRQLQRSGWQA